MRFLLTCVLTMIFIGSAVMAMPKYLDSFKKSYPEAIKTKLDSCSLCHPVKGKMKEQNTFALDFKKAGHDFAKIAAVDSDQDRFTNLEEIAAGTLPSNKTDKPDIPALVKQVKELNLKINELEAKLKTKL